MERANQVGHEGRSSKPGTAGFENLIPIAVVIAAGCEPCAERMVERALRQGTPRHLIERTLGIVARLHSADCLADAVGAEVVARMDKPLEAARRTLREQAPAGKEPQCCR
jgi:alkylhydroperoxidase/carboxymuconolactone decarboxylase family protein YurZ